MLAIGAEFGSQAGKAGVNRAVAYHVGPDVADNFLARVHAVTVFKEEEQQIEFRASQRSYLPVNISYLFVTVQAQTLKDDVRLIFRF